MSEYPEYRGKWLPRWDALERRREEMSSNALAMPIGSLTFGAGQKVFVTKKSLGWRVHLRTGRDGFHLGLRQSRH